MAKTPNGPTMLSIRLTPEERNLVEAAATQKGWKAATFLRNASLERAANILNLAKPTSFDFNGLARQVASRLVKEREATLVTAASREDEVLGVLTEGSVLEDELKESGVQLEDAIIGTISPEPLRGSEISALEEALRLGGVEFAAALIVECHRLSGRIVDDKLPPPIDPRNLKS